MIVTFCGDGVTVLGLVGGASLGASTGSVARVSELVSDSAESDPESTQA